MQFQSSSPLSSQKRTTLERVTTGLIPLTYRFARAVIAVSDGVAEDLITMSSSLKERIKVMPSPVISHEMLTLAEAPITHPWFLHPEIQVIVCAARMEPDKGYDTLISAFDRLRARVDAKLVILGNGTQRDSIQRRVAALDLSEHIDFLGFNASTGNGLFVKSSLVGCGISCADLILSTRNRRLYQAKPIKLKFYTLEHPGVCCL